MVVSPVQSYVGGVPDDSINGERDRSFKRRSVGSVSVSVRRGVGAQTAYDGLDFDGLHLAVARVDLEPQRHLVAGLERLLEIHEHQVITARPQFERLARRQRQTF